MKAEETRRIVEHDEDSDDGNDEIIDVQDAVLGRRTSLGIRRMTQDG